MSDTAREHRHRAARQAAAGVVIVSEVSFLAADKDLVYQGILACGTSMPTKALCLSSPQ